MARLTQICVICGLEERATDRFVLLRKHKMHHSCWFSASGIISSGPNHRLPRHLGGGNAIGHGIRVPEDNFDEIDK